MKVTTPGFSGTMTIGCDATTNPNMEKFSCCIENGQMCDDGCTGDLPSTGKPKANWKVYSTGASAQKSAVAALKKSIIVARESFTNIVTIRLLVKTPFVRSKRRTRVECTSVTHNHV